MKVLLILGVIGTFFYILDTWKMYRLWKQGEQMVSFKIVGVIKRVKIRQLVIAILFMV